MVEQVVCDVRANWDILASPSGGSGGIGMSSSFSPFTSSEFEIMSEDRKL